MFFRSRKRDQTGPLERCLKVLKPFRTSSLCLPLRFSCISLSPLLHIFSSCGLTCTSSPLALFPTTRDRGLYLVKCSDKCLLHGSRALCAIHLCGRRRSGKCQISYSRDLIHRRADDGDQAETKLAVENNGKVMRVGRGSETHAGAEIGVRSAPRRCSRRKSDDRRRGGHIQVGKNKRQTQASEVTCTEKARRRCQRGEIFLEAVRQKTKNRLKS